jgi:hypothetical protein
VWRAGWIQTTRCSQGGDSTKPEFGMALPSQAPGPVSPVGIGTVIYMTWSSWRSRRLQVVLVAAGASLRQVVVCPSTSIITINITNHHRTSSILVRLSWLRVLGSYSTPQSHIDLRLDCFTTRARFRLERSPDIITSRSRNAVLDLFVIAASSFRRSMTKTTTSPHHRPARIRLPT